MSKITVEAVVRVGKEAAWRCWTEPTCITAWAFASDEWECPVATNDVRVGGRFMSRMQAKDGSGGFDFSGTYTEATPLEKLAYVMDDGRTCEVLFEESAPGQVKVTEVFDAETENPEEMQRQGWQEILNNFVKHAESHA